MERITTPTKRVLAMADTPRPPLPQRRGWAGMDYHYRTAAQQLLKDKQACVGEDYTPEACAVFLGRALVVIEGLLECLPNKGGE